MSLSVIGAVAAVVIGGTSAFFSDTETSMGNTFTAGAIDLKVDSTATYNGVSVAAATWAEKDLVPTADKFFNFGDVKPGDSGENTISLHVINNDAWVCATVSGLTNDENGINEPEGEAGDTTQSVGELQQNLVLTVWRDNGAGSGIAGDNIQNGTEEVLYTGAPQDDVWAIYDSATETGPLAGGTTGYLGVAWSLPIGTGNEVQTDSMTGDISFNVVQARNNGAFKCSDGITTVVHQAGLETGSKVTANGNGKWFFYDDTNDTVMIIDQFSSTGGQNHMESVAGSGGAKMVLGSETDPRYNIATYKYKDVKLSNINTLKYRVYDPSVSGGSPYLNFNIDFNNSDTWQRRLVQSSATIPVSTWTEVDALAEMWHLSGGNWPVGSTTTVPFSGSTNRTWSAIVADYPNAETRSTDSWLGVRVGHPGPTGEEGVVDWIQFNSEKTDFEN